MSPDSALCVYDELRAALLPVEDGDSNPAQNPNPIHVGLFDVLNRALYIVARQQQCLKKKRTDEITQQLFSLVEKAGRLPAEYPDHVANCLLLSRQGALLDDVSVDQLMHRSILDVICRCGLTCHLMALMVDGQVTVDQLFKIHPLKGVNESPFTYAVISNHTTMVFLITTFNEYGCTDEDESIELANSMRMCTALRTKGMSDRIPLHYCAINRNEWLFKCFLLKCPDTLFYFDKSGYTPSLYLMTAWADASRVLEDAVDPVLEDLDQTASIRYQIAVNLMTALPNPSVAADDDAGRCAVTNSSFSANSASTFSIQATTSATSTESAALNNVKTEHNGIKQEAVATVDFEEEERRYESCTRLNLKTGRDLINWAAQDAGPYMVELLLDTFTGVTKTSACPNSVYFQHLLRYDPYDCEPILAAYTAGAEINFFELLRKASAELFCDNPRARRPPHNISEDVAQFAAENEAATIFDLVKKYFLDDEKNGLASKLMKSVIMNIFRNENDGAAFPRAASDNNPSSSRVKNEFLRAKSAIKKFLKYDISCGQQQQQERAVLLYKPAVSSAESQALKLKNSFAYIQQSKVSPDAKHEFFDSAAESILMPKMRCDCEFFELPCSSQLETVHIDWPPPTKGCPCLGPLAQCHNNDPNSRAEIGNLASVWTLIPDMDTFPKMAGYYWQKRDDLQERKGPLVFDLRVVPRNDDGTEMAFIYACSDECRCDESNCPTSTVFAMSRCFFTVIDYSESNNDRLGIQRCGLETREMIMSGQFVGKIVGNLCTQQDVDELASDEFVADEFSTVRWQYVKRLPLPFGKSMRKQMSKSQLKAFDFYVDQYRFGNFTRFIRHACKPNANLSVHLMLPRGTVDLRQRVMVLFANRLIEAGEELTMDFGDWFLNQTAADAFCGCGLAGCRKPLPPL